MATEFVPLDAADRQLVDAATDLLHARYACDKHTVAAAVRCAGGRVYTGINLDGTAYGPCAEPVAIGAAITAGETQITTIVAVGRRGDGVRVLSPCGNCRQLMLDYAPNASVILNVGGELRRAAVADLLPGPYTG